VAKKHISATEILQDIRHGLSDKDLTDKYGLSLDGLLSVFNKMIEAGILTQKMLDERTRGFDLDVDVTISKPDGSRTQDKVPAAHSTLDSSPTEPRPSDEELRSYERKAFWGLIISIGLGFVGAILMGAGEVAKGLGSLVSLVSTVLYFRALYHLLKRKGYHWAWTFLGVLSCVGLIIILLLADKYRLPKSGYMTPLLVILIGFILLAVVGIILAIAIPYYVGYKRAACDRAADGELVRLQTAFDKYINDPGNRTREAPRDLSPLVGQYYGWNGTSEKCKVLIRYNSVNQEAEAVALMGSRPGDNSSRYVYGKNLSTGSELKAQVTSSVDPFQFLAYPSEGAGRTTSCFDEQGRLLDDCREKQRQ